MLCTWAIVTQFTQLMITDPLLSSILFEVGGRLVGEIPNAEEVRVADKWRIAWPLRWDDPKLD